MAILIGIWEAIVVLIIVVFLTTLALWWYWQRRLAVLRDVIATEQVTEIRDMIKDFKHQASHCL